MPVILTFDIAGAPPIERNRIQCAFERFGWENLGGSSYRYPRLGAAQLVEDWFNHVIPALMLFRVYVVESGRPLSKFSLDAYTSTGANPNGGFGNLPMASGGIAFSPPNNQQFGLGNLQNWLDNVGYPYAVGP